MEEYEKCQEGLLSEVPLLPTRVIVVERCEGSQNPRIYPSRPNERGHYVALSYVWGGDQPMTTGISITRFTTQGIPPEEMAQSTKDAIRATQQLGIRYLWIDAVCIIQDNEADKARELQVMGRIYRDATLTISASSSKSARLGFAKWDPLTACQLPFMLPNGSMGSVAAVPSLIELPQNITRPIDRRGWTFQERLLSKRLLIFDKGELKWQRKFSRRFVDP